MTIKGEDPTFLDEKNDGKQYQDNGIVLNEAVDVCPTKIVHSFYFVKFSAYEDQMLKVRSGIEDAIKLKKDERNKIASQLWPLIFEDKSCREIPSARSARRERVVLGLCSSEQDLNVLVRSLRYRLQHESMTVVKEKSLLAEIKQLERTRDEIIANGVVKEKFQYYPGIQDSWYRSLKNTIANEFVGDDLEELRRKKTVLSMKVKCLEEKVKIISKTINLWKEELTTLHNEPGEACKVLVQLREQRNAWNEHHCNNVSLLIDRKHGKEKDITTLEKASHTKVEQFMSLWNKDETFRSDYKRSMLRSLNKRKLSQDGRIRTPGEKPLV